MTLQALYTAITGEQASGRAIGLELAKEDPRRQAAVRMRLDGRTLREIAAELGISHGSAQSLIELSMQAARKRLLALPRYHNIGHPGPTDEQRRGLPKRKRRRAHN